MFYSFFSTYESLLMLTQKEIKVKYKNNIFGYLWALANPLFFTCIYYFAFKVFMKVQIPNYPFFLVCGLFPWQWISNSINNGAWCFLGNAQIIKKTTFPKFILILSNVFMEGFHFLMALPIIIAFMIYTGIDFNYKSLLCIPLLIILQTIFTFGFSLVFSTLCVFFRDIERFLTLGMTAIFYATPIFYSPNMIPAEYKWIVDINPFAQIIISWRDVFMNGYLEMNTIITLLWWSLFFVALGLVVYNKLKFKFAEVM
ncbi:ABC transporter permease [Tatumella sp. TA1]|nr:ABC transporter permease [Tatumella sp. TA1]